MPIVIDDNLRTMTIPTDLVLLGVESDDDVNKIPFRMPKTYNGYDLSTFEARINYMNARGEGDIYVAEDLTVDGDEMTFTWIVGRNACKYKGDTKFIVCLKKFDQDNICIQEFNTTVYKLPVLEGLETYEAVIQENADIIEQLLSWMEESGTFVPSLYYTRAQIDGMKFPNPKKLTINGTEYDGSATVDVTVEPTAEFEQSYVGIGNNRILSFNDAVPDREAIAYSCEDENYDPVSGFDVIVCNKNLFRASELPQTSTASGITFRRYNDGRINIAGQSTVDDVAITYTMNPYIFQQSVRYVLYSGKSIGAAEVFIELTYENNLTDRIVSKNAAVIFKPRYKVVSAVAGINVPEQYTVISSENVYPQLEIGDWATGFVKSDYTEFYYDGTNKPTIPASRAVVIACSYDVDGTSITLVANSTLEVVDEYIKENVVGSSITGSIVADYDGNGTVSIGLGG